MRFIKNLDVGMYTMSKENFCSKCSNRGRIKVVRECDREKFNKEYDRLDSSGMEPYLIYDKAIEGCQYDYHYCPDCEEGQKYKDKYPVYNGI